MSDHHAYLYRTVQASPESVKKFVTSLNLSEVTYFTKDSFVISDVKLLTEKAYMRPMVESRQLIVVCTNSITVEAQQALLKILEEPPLSTVFIFCVPHTLYLLPTLLSRFQDKTEALLQKSSNEANLTFSNFIKLSVPDRFNEISSKLALKNSDWVNEIKNGLLDNLVIKAKDFSADELNLLFWVAEHLQTRGSSNKLLLEELALTYKIAAE